MTGLAEIQARFQGHVVGNGTDATGLFVGDATATAAERAGVYYDAYRLRLLEVLEDDFPGVRKLAGAEAFRDFGLRYIDRYPSTRPSVRWFGRHFAAFLEEATAGTERAGLAEMAAFELARTHAFDGPEAATATLDDLARYAPEAWPGLRLAIHPTLTLCRCEWNTGTVWRAILDEQPIPESAREAAPAHWAVWRKNIKVYWRSIGDDEAVALRNFGCGETFADVCDALCGQIEADDVPARLAAMLNQWIGDGMIAAISEEN